MSRRLHLEKKIRPPPDPAGLEGVMDLHCPEALSGLSNSVSYAAGKLLFSLADKERAEMSFPDHQF